ncbi:hypothetical protein [Aeromicrobium sp.]|uniref:hypothetical protein n=1 Tax=Aeromicrobium sp. TaxID=1871063 RepID=UPI002FC8945B
MPFGIMMLPIVGLLLVLPVLIGRKVGRLRIVLPLAASATAVAMYFAWMSVGEREVLEELVSADGNTIVLAYSGSACEDQRSVSVEESSKSVRVTVTTRSFAFGCSDVGMFYRVTVKLDQPLGSRGVVNAGCTSEHIGCTKILRLDSD